MTVKMVSGILECEEKYLMKLRIQQDIINTRFSINRASNTNGSMPLTSTVSYTKFGKITIYPRLDYVMYIDIYKYI